MPNPLQKLVQSIAATAPAAALIAPLAHRLDAAVLRLSGGRTTAVGLLSGLPLITLTTVGARSGELRTVPLVGLPDGDNLVLVASNFGQARHPAWYHNLAQNPYASVTLGGVTRKYKAHEATGAEYDRLWQRATDLYAGYAAYKQRTGGRHIPILVLAPQS